MYCLSVCKYFWGTKWYKQMRLTIATFEHMGYWGEYGVHSNFFAIPSLLYHPRRFVLAERFNTRWVFLTLEMKASWNFWVWDGNSKPKYKNKSRQYGPCFPQLAWRSPRGYLFQLHVFSISRVSLGGRGWHRTACARKDVLTFLPQQPNRIWEGCGLSWLES